MIPREPGWNLCGACLYSVEGDGLAVAEGCSGMSTGRAAELCQGLTFQCLLRIARWALLYNAPPGLLGTDW